MKLVACGGPAQETASLTNQISSWQEIGEEFVEFLEKELNITDPETETNEEPRQSNPFSSSATENTESRMRNEAGKGSSIEESIDDIEATLAKLKKELGL